MIINSGIYQYNNKEFGCELEIIYDSKHMPLFGPISYKVNKSFETRLEAMAFYCLHLHKENRCRPCDVDLANNNSNVKLTPTKFTKYLNKSMEIFPELWI